MVILMTEIHDDSDDDDMTRTLKYWMSLIVGRPLFVYLTERQKTNATSKDANTPLSMPLCLDTVEYQQIGCRI